MDAYMNKEQQVPEDQQAAKATMEHAKGKKRVHTAQKYIEFFSDSLSSSSSDDLSDTSSDNSYDSVKRQKPTKPVSSSNKSSTFQDKRKSDNEETPLKQPHHDAFTSKQEILERINCLHKECGFLYTENLFMLPIIWFNHREVPHVNVEILQNFYNSYHTPKYFCLERFPELGSQNPRSS